jgi:predicted nuclease with TOPRIM domain
MTEITLEFIAKQLERVISEQGALRDEMLVLGARMTKVEAGVAVIAAEVHALANQLARIGLRVEMLEDRMDKLEEA